jgi:NAD(P)-dependent dehydrogenase (short-subunit alcohol dehydrogenase family)
MTGRLADRVCLVTGSTGIAAAAAVLLARQGASIFVASRTGAHADALAARIRSAGGRAGARAADLSREADAEAAVGACVEAYGRIDGLLSVAGGSGRHFGDGPIHELTAEGWDRTLEQNLRSQAMVSRAVARQMLGQEPNASGTRGSIVLISSVLASRPVPELFATHAYAAAKGAIASLGLAMAATYAASGIRVNVLAPGLTDTLMAARAAADPATVAFVRRKQPLAAGFLEADDVASAAVYLLADESRAVTGQVLAVDGGWSVVSVSASPEPSPGP